MSESVAAHDATRDLDLARQHPQAWAVHQFLCSPAAYPERPATVQVIETHVSWLYFTERFVYKQKKPVQYDFLDFSTLAARRQACQDEVALNRRFSPEVYLGVLAVRWEDGELRLPVSEAGTQAAGGGSSVVAEPVEYLVKMKRLPESSCLQRHLQQSLSSNALLRDLPGYLAQLYSTQAPAMVRSDQFLQNLRQHIDDNANSLSQFHPQRLTEIIYVRNALRAYVTLRQDLFAARICDGRVIDGHGDLRPEHIYLQRNRPQIIDCVEFHAAYRVGDVVDDLAFLAMECRRQGADALATAICQEYCQVSGDRAPESLWAFYQSYRAGVRAKVTGLQGELRGGKQRRELRRISREYLDVAHAQAKSLGRPRLVIIGGGMGCGKSTLAAALQERLGARLLSTDRIRREVLPPDRQSSFASGGYSHAAREAVYEQLYERIPAAFDESPIVILDGSFDTHAQRMRTVQVAAELGADVLQAQCECPLSLAEQRVAQRLQAGGGDSDARPELVRAQAAASQGPLEHVPSLRLNTEQAIPAQVDAVLARLASSVV